MDFPTTGAMRERFRRSAAATTRENAAASVQALLEWGHPRVGARGCSIAPACDGSALAGGVFANVRLNRLLAENLPVDEVFVVPADGR